MDMYYHTDIGLVRACNEDSVAICQTEHSLLAIVADGMGGHKAGEVASKMAIEMFQSSFENTLKATDPEAVERWLKKTMLEANKTIYEYAKQYEECTGMGTTVVVAVCYGKHVTIGHIGDSRCYLVQKQQLYQLTEDHSFVNYLLKIGDISKEEAVNHPQKNMLTKALGTEKNVRGEVRTIPINMGDQLLLCSDGLYGGISDEVLLEVLSKTDSAKERGDELVQLAKENGGDDNITLILLRQQALDEMSESQDQGEKLA